MVEMMPPCPYDMVSLKVLCLISILVSFVLKNAMSPPDDELIMLNVELIILKVSPFGWIRHEAMDPSPPFMLLNTESFIVKS